MSNRVNVDQLLADFNSAALKANFEVHTYGSAHGYPLYAFTRNSASANAPHVYISTGIHGDEPAPPLALLRILQNDALPDDRNYYLCPCMNPVGLHAGTRENIDAIDLNRDFTAFQTSEIRQHRDWLEAHIPQLSLAIHLHEDWESSGFYLYELNFQNNPSRARSILTAAAAHLPIETAEQIDGYPAKAGIIRPTSLPDIPEGLPEALYLQQRYQSLNYTLETPSALALDTRIDAMEAALLAALICDPI